jgi:hypothetical protein
VTIREDTLAAFQATSQILVLLEAQAVLLKSQMSVLMHHPDAERRDSPYSMTYTLFDRVKNAIRHNQITQKNLLARLDPFGDNFNYAPPVPVDITPYGIIERTTGFCSYISGLGPQSVLTNTPYTVLNDAATTFEAQKPRDIVTFYDGDKLIAVQDDALLYSITFKARPTDNVEVASELKMYLNYAPGTRLFEQTKLLSGYDEIEPVSYQTSVYVGATFAANGATLVVEADGPIEITDVSFLVTRLHKGV